MSDKKEALKAIEAIKPKVDELNKVVDDLEVQRKQHVTFIADNKESYDLDVLNQVKENEKQVNQIDEAIKRAETDLEALKEANSYKAIPALRAIIKADEHSQDKEYKELEKQIEKVIALHDKIREQENKLIEEARTLGNELRPYLTNKGNEEVRDITLPAYTMFKITQTPKDLKYYVENIVEHARGQKKL